MVAKKYKEKNMWNEDYLYIAHLFQHDLLKIFYSQNNPVQHHTIYQDTLIFQD